MQEPSPEDMGQGKVLGPQKLEIVFEEYMADLGRWLQDGVMEVNLEFLKKFDLLSKTEEQEKEMQKQFPFYFHVVETPEKVTLFNNQFAIWIVPKLISDTPTTITLVSLIRGDTPHLEIAFSTQGVYNTPKYVLKVLRHFLTEVIDTEEEIASIWKVEGE
ncbi:MAG: hypothetical protein FJZ56_00955 [Chlamydiae bacterium]|nr:hypothetical protein [Chlamydiota bacterium]